MSTRDYNDDAWNAELERRLATADAAIDPPADLSRRVVARLHVERRHRALRLFVWPAAVAACVALVLLWNLPEASEHGTATVSAPVSVNNDAARGSNGSRGTPQRAHVRFAPGSGWFGRTVETRDPQVTLVMVYREVATRFDETSFSRPDMNQTKGNP